MARRYRIPLAILLVGATADALTTYAVIHELGAGAELHPAQRVVLGVFGAGLGVPIAKVIQLAFVILVACWWRPWCGWILTVCGLLYTLAAMSNHFGWL